MEGCHSHCRDALLPALRWQVGSRCAGMWILRGAEFGCLVERGASLFGGVSPALQKPSQFQDQPFPAAPLQIMRLRRLTLDARLLSCLLAEATLVRPRISVFP